MGVLFVLSGYLMNIVGERAIYRYINEAKNWEREGIFHKSETLYFKALEIFDSCLLTAFSSRKTALPLTGAIARFSLNASWHNEHFDMATIFFLQKHPHETEVALLWLKNMVKRKNTIPFSSQEERLLTLLAEMEPLSSQLVPFLATIFTKTRREDFAAKRIFSIINDKEVENSSIDGLTNKNSLYSDIGKRVECFEIVKESLANPPDMPLERAEKNFIEESESISDKYLENKIARHIPDKHLPGNVFENELIGISDKPAFVKSHQASRLFSNRKLKQKKLPAIIAYCNSAIEYCIAIIVKGILWLSSLPLKSISIIIKTIHFLLKISIELVNQISQRILSSQYVKKNIKRIIFFLVLTGLVMLLVNTVSHLFHTPLPPSPPSIQQTITEDIEVQTIPQKKFTIQVAAYLSKSHAEQYLKNLEKKGISGGVINAVEGGGKTWYLIRVGQYKTKESAAEYGNSLKTKGVVDDFFVDNSGG